MDETSKKTINDFSRELALYFRFQRMKALYIEEVRRQGLVLSELSSDLPQIEVGITIDTLGAPVTYITYSGPDRHRLDQNLEAKNGITIFGIIEGTTSTLVTECLDISNATYNGQSIGCCRIPLMHINTINGKPFYKAGFE